MLELEKNCKIIKEKDLDDAETRKFAIKSLETIFTKVGCEVFNMERFDRLMNMVFYVMDDYTTDRRGDIGSIVRETAMYTMFNILRTLCKTESPEVIQKYLPANRIELIIGALLQQLVEKIDKMRLIAGHILQKIFDDCYEQLPEFSEKENLHKIFSNKAIRERVEIDLSRIYDKFDISLIDTSFLEYSDNENLVYFWNVPYCVFRTITPLITSSTYSPSICRGIALSAGGITETTMSHSVKNLTAVLESLSEDTQENLLIKSRILDTYIKILGKFAKMEKFLTPLFNT